jgi:hypothetical protein
MYAMDSLKASQRFTLTVGSRVTWNTNPVNQHGLFARPAGSFLDMARNVSQPLNQTTQIGHHGVDAPRGLIPSRLMREESWPLSPERIGGAG